MIDMALPDEHSMLRARLNGETARAPWTDLQRFFASGNVIVVQDGLDLIEVAMCFANDDSARVAAWLHDGSVARVSDAQAGQWLEANAMVWTVVVKPWLLVQQQKEAHGQQ